MSFQRFPQFARALALLFVQLSLLPMVSACAIPGPTDVSFVGAKVVDVRSVPSEVALHANATLLDVTLSTNTDLFDLAQRHSFEVMAEMSLCRTRAENRVLDPYLLVYWHGLRVYPDGQRDLGRNKIYDVYIQMQRDARRSPVPDEPPFPAYDLARRPEDLCFIMRGGNEIGTHFVSNRVIVPAGVLAAITQSFVEPVR